MELYDWVHKRHAKAKWANEDFLDSAPIKWKMKIDPYTVSSLIMLSPTNPGTLFFLYSLLSNYFPSLSISLFPFPHLSVGHVSRPLPFVTSNWCDCMYYPIFVSTFHLHAWTNKPSFLLLSFMRVLGFFGLLKHTKLVPNMMGNYNTSIYNKPYHPNF